MFCSKIVFRMLCCFIVMATCVFLTITQATTLFTQKGDPYCQCCVGATGPAGPPGVPGPKGMYGYKGQKGETGDPGPIGPEGLKGERGRRGKKGPKGEPGQTGPQGYRGDPGYEGPSGIKGQKGEPASPTKKIAFSATRTSPLGPVTEDTIVTFDNILTNLGHSFDPYTSTFTCKVNGTYMFISHLLSNQNHDAYGWIMMNGNFIVPLHGDKRSGYGTGSNTVILQLVKEDHVWVQLTKNSSILNDFSTFSGYLIYEA